MSTPIPSHRSLSLPFLVTSLSPNYSHIYTLSPYHFLSYFTTNLTPPRSLDSPQVILHASPHYPSLEIDFAIPHHPHQKKRFPLKKKFKRKNSKFKIQKKTLSQKKEKGKRDGRKIKVYTSNFPHQNSTPKPQPCAQ